MRTRRARDVAAALPPATRVEELKQQLESLRDEKEQTESDIAQAERDLQKAKKKLKDVEAKIVETEELLEETVAQPLDDGRDATLLLPDELLLVILLRLPPASVMGERSCALVCKRWAALMQLPQMKRHKQNELRWEAFADESRNPLIKVMSDIHKPRWLSVPNTVAVYAIALSSDGKSLYTGSSTGSICVQSAEPPFAGARAIVGHTATVNALTVGADGVLYSASSDKTIRVWTADGAPVRTIEGHTDYVLGLLLESTGQKLFSCSTDKTIRVWSVHDGAHVQTLDGHTDRVHAMVEGSGGRLYSASHDRTIRVWSVDEGAHLQTLDPVEDGDGSIKALAIAPNGCLISAALVYYNKRYKAGTVIRVWSADGAPLRRLCTDNIRHLHSICLGRHGRIFVSSGTLDIHMLSFDTGAYLGALYGGQHSAALCFNHHNGKLFSSEYGAGFLYW